MSQPSSPSPPDDPPAEAPAPTAAVEPNRPPSRLGRLVLASALAAGLASWLLGETSLVRIPVVEQKMTVLGRTFESSTPQSRMAAADADAARFYGVFGATLGLALGLAGGVYRGSYRAAGLAAVLGAAVGAAGGLVAARVAIPLYHRNQYTISNDLLASLAMHGLSFAVAGAAAGLALGIALGAGARGIARMTLGGVLGAVIGAVVAEFLGALLFPSSETGQPLAAVAPARLLAPMVVSAAASLGALLALVAPGAQERPA
jgi:hypothetical protein